MRCAFLVLVTALMVCSCVRHDVLAPEGQERTSRPADETLSAPTAPSASSSAAASPSATATAPDAKTIDDAGPVDVTAVEAEEETEDPVAKGGVSGERRRGNLDIHYQTEPSDLSSETSVAIRRFAMRKRHRFANCMNAHPGDSSQPSGTFVVRLYVRREGSVLKAAVDFSRFPLKESWECIEGVAREFGRETLPMQESSVVVNVSYSASTR